MAGFEIETSANDSLSISIGRFSDSPDLHFKENLARFAAVEIADAHDQNPPNVTLPKLHQWLQLSNLS